MFQSKLFLILMAKMRVKASDNQESESVVRIRKLAEFVSEEIGKNEFDITYALGVGDFQISSIKKTSESKGNPARLEIKSDIVSIVIEPANSVEAFDHSGAKMTLNSIGHELVMIIFSALKIMESAKIIKPGFRDRADEKGIELLPSGSSLSKKGVEQSVTSSVDMSLNSSMTISYDGFDFVAEQCGLSPSPIKASQVRSGLSLGNKSNP